MSKTPPIKMTKAPVQKGCDARGLLLSQSMQGEVEMAKRHPILLLLWLLFGAGAGSVLAALCFSFNNDDTSGRGSPVAQTHKPVGRTFFVSSSSGDDGNDGLSPRSAWRSLKKVNSAPLRPGDRVLFKRGDVWRGQLIPQSGEEGAPIVYGAYGEGEKPLILGSVSRSKPSQWQRIGENLWATAKATFTELEPLNNFATSPWTVHFEGGAKVRFSILKANAANAPPTVRIECVQSGTALSHIQLYNRRLTLRSGEYFEFTFRIRCTKPFILSEIALMKEAAPWTRYGTLLPIPPSRVEVGEDWKEVSVRFKAAQTADDGRITLYLGGVLPSGSALEFQPLSWRRIRCNEAEELSVDVGNIIFDDGRAVGVKKWSLEDLKRQGDFWYDGQNWRVVIYSEGNPAKIYSSIELALRRHIIDQSNKHHIVYEGLALRYGAAHGIGGGNTHNIVVRNCDISFIGGGHQFTRPDGTPVRFGNGVEFWGNTHDNLVESCRIWEVYDAALTNQNNAPNVKQFNIVYRHNIIWNCEYSFEYWNRPESSETFNIRFERNICVNAGYGWGHSQRPDPNGRHLMFYFNSAQTRDFYVRHNIFYNATESCLRMDNDWRHGLIMDYNCWYQPKGILARFLNLQFTPEQFEEYKRQTGFDAHSIFADPKFIDIDNLDFRLPEDSPARWLFFEGFSPRYDESQAKERRRGAKSWYETTRHGIAFRNVLDFGAKGDGVTDDTAAIQAAIDYQRGSRYEKSPAIVYLPAGTYKVTDTLILWKWTHLIGDPNSPPTILLAANSPGFDNPKEKKPVIVTTNGWNVDPGTRNWAANSDKLGGTANNTFYTQIHNITVRIEPGNPGAVGILWRVAQGTSMRNVTIDAGDAAIGLDVGGDVDYEAFDEPPSQAGGGTIEDVRIQGGQIGLRARGSQWLFRSVHLKNQRDVGVYITECWNFDFIDLCVEDAPLGMRIERSMSVILLDSHFRKIHNGRAIETDGSWCYLENVVCDQVGWVLDNLLPGDPKKRVRINSWFQGKGIVNGKFVHGDSLPLLRKEPLPLRPCPTLDDDSIVNVLDCGAVGDGIADDTAAIQRAINQYRTVFLPFGRYKVSDTIKLRSDTRLFGEGLSEIFLADNAPGFNDPEHPKLVIETPDDPEGTIVLANLRITAGEGNIGAVMVDWQVGERSGMWDVHIKPEPKSGVKYHLRLRGHGGGYFANMWNPGTKNSAGFMGSSKGRAWFYNTPFEHHSQVAYHLNGAQNYTFVTAQTENSPLAMLIENSRNILVYGTVFTFWGQMQPNLVKVINSGDLAIYGLNCLNSEQLIFVEPPQREPFFILGGKDWHRLTVMMVREGK